MRKTLSANLDCTQSRRPCNAGIGMGLPAVLLWEGVNREPGFIGCVVAKCRARATTWSFGQEGPVLPRASVRRVGLLHPRRDVPMAVQDTPDVDVIVALDGEDQVGIARQWPGMQSRQVQLVGVVGVSRWRDVG